MLGRMGTTSIPAFHLSFHLARDLIDLQLPSLGCKAQVVKGFL
jgi:hypothetical protein